MKIIRKIKYPITILLFIILICYFSYLKKILNQEKYVNISNQEEQIIKEDNNIEEEVQEICHIDIKGAVKKPGVYQINCNSTVNDAIKSAEGLTNEADTSVINLAKKIKDEMVIIIYTKEEVKNSNIVDTVIKVVEQECVCPNIENDGCINNEINDNIGNENNQININNATLDDLMTLPGIGEGKAKSIIEYRDKIGQFETIEDLLEVNGIGNALYEQIKIYIKA